MLAQITYEQLLEKLKTDLPSQVQAIQHHPWPSWFKIAAFAIAALIFAAFLHGFFFTVGQQRFRIVTRFGKHKKVAQAGLHFKLPLIDRAISEWSLEIKQLETKVETITKDKVTVVLKVPIQYFIIPGREYDAAWKCSNNWKRMESVAFDLIRSNVPKLTLDELFGSKDEIGNVVQAELKADMEQFGIDISRVMIVEIEPNDKVKFAMNEINAAQKQGEAELAKAHNEQLVQVARAKGRLEASQLNKQAEIVDAEAVSKSVEIIGKSLHDNHGYLQWKWIHMMEDTSNATIYVPTEAGLPILEAGKRRQLNGEHEINEGQM